MNKRRIISMMLKNILYLPYAWSGLYYHAAHPYKYTDEEQYYFIQKLIGKLLLGSKVNVETHGTEYLNNARGVLLVPNHQGIFDAFALLYACPVPFRAVFKKELKEKPILKQVALCLSCISLERENARQAMEVISKMSEDLKAGKNLLIFPEGTRSHNGNQLLEFKGGSFKSAQRTKCPIVPVAIIDSFKPFDSKSLEEITVQIHFLKPIPHKDYVNMKTVEIAAMVKQQIEETISKFNKGAVFYVADTS